MVAGHPAFMYPFMASSPHSPSQPPQLASNNATSEKPIVFVAGATGNVGRRLVRKLAEAGCAVRAGSRNAVKCKETIGDISALPGTIEHVRFDVTENEALLDAIGPASVVVSTLGAAFSWGRVDGQGIADLMTVAAGSPSVRQLIAVSSIGVGRPWAMPAALLNLFGGVLLFKDYSEHVMRRVAQAQGKQYLIVRPGGMEAPKDDFYLKNNLRLEKRNALSKGNVSNMQVAELIVAAVLDPEAANGKTVEAVAGPDFPKVDLDTLLRSAQRD